MVNFHFQILLSGFMYDETLAKAYQPTNYLLFDGSEILHHLVKTLKIMG